jgi:hypothetical protein
MTRAHTSDLAENNLFIFDRACEGRKFYREFYEFSEIRTRANLRSVDNAQNKSKISFIPSPVCDGLSLVVRRTRATAAKRPLCRPGMLPGLLKPSTLGNEANIPSKRNRDTLSSTTCRARAAGSSLQITTGETDERY